MLALQRTLSFGYLRRRWTRTVLIVLSIALGVAALVGTRALATNLNKGAEISMNPLSDLADLVVVKGQTGLPRELVQKLRDVRIPGVKEVYALVIGHVGLPDYQGKTVWLLGVDVYDTRQLNKLKVNWNDLSEVDHPWGTIKPSPVASRKWAARWAAEWMRRWQQPKERPGMIGDRLLAELGWGSLDEERVLRVHGGEKKLDVAVVGTVTLKGEAAAHMTTGFIALEITDAARLLMPRQPDHVTQLNITLEEGADREATRKRVQEFVGDAGYVRTVEDNNASVRDVTAGLELGFTLGGAGALVVGLFLVYNALSVSVAERRHDIGIMRSVGATRGQVARLFVVEAALLGLVGALLGLPLGYALARVALGPVRRVLGEIFLPLPETDLVLSWPTMVFAVVAGVGTAVLAALFPARLASREEPVEAVRRVPRATRFFLRLVQLAVGLLLLGAGLAAPRVRDQLPPRASAFGGVICLMVGALVLTPLVAAGLGRLLQPVFRRLFGLEGRLAADNLLRHPGRCGLVIAALAATGGLVMQTAGFIRSSETAILTWLDEQVGADLFVTSGASVTSGMLLPMSPDVGKDIRQQPGVKFVLPVRSHRLDYQGRILVLLALDSGAFDDDPDATALGRHLKEFPRLREGGTALVSENFAALYNVKPGQFITIDGLKSPVKLEVLGTVVDYTWNRGTVIVDRKWYRREYQDDQVDLFDIWLEPGADAHRTAEQFQGSRWALENAVFVVPRDVFRRELSNILQRVYGLAYAQQVVVALVALMGVISSLFISVLQRRRELGLLRAVGATRGQVLWSVLAEATLMAIIGAVIGFAIGLLLEWYVLDFLILDEAGFVFPMLLPWATCAVVFGLSVVLATLVGLWPAYHATRLRITEAIAYE